MKIRTQRGIRILALTLAAILLICCAAGCAAAGAQKPAQESFSVVEGTRPTAAAGAQTAESAKPSEAQTSQGGEEILPTVKPSKTEAPSSSEKPTQTERPTEKPTQTERPTEKPTQTERPTEKPTQTVKPTSTPKPSESPTIDEDGRYTKKEDVALYIHTYGRLPDNFITKSEARKLGWEGGSLEPFAPGCSIGGDRFGNYEGLLPDGKYTECDINTMGAKSRGAKRIVFSDKAIYYTDDHYESFEKLY